MELLDIGKIETNQMNPNYMEENYLEKLENLIKMENNYPPLIVNKRGDKYILLDGHQRLRVLKKLKKKKIKVDIWEVSYEQELLLLATLNKLHGRSIQEKRIELYSKLKEILPESKIKKLTTDANSIFESIKRIKENKKEQYISMQREQIKITIQLIQMLDREEYEFVNEYIEKKYKDRNKAIYYMVKTLKEHNL